MHPMDAQTSSGGGEPPYAPKYAILSENGGAPNSVRPHPHRRNIPRYHSTPQPNKKVNCCLKCICCFYCCSFFLVFAISAMSFYLYALYEPKVPTYKIDHIDVRAFDVQVDFNLYAEIYVTVIAENPNERISIFYGADSEFVVLYLNSVLCSGSMPSFYQGHKNATTLKVALKGKSEFGSDLQTSLTRNQKAGKIPLTIRIRLPTIVELGDIPLRQFTAFVNCSMIIDSLTPKKKVSILSTKYSAGAEL